jgi:hypothetical protein
MTGRGARIASASVLPATAGDHGRSTPLGLTASTANPVPVRRRAIGPWLRKRSWSITGDEHEGDACRAVTTSAARAQSSVSASGRSASVTNAPSAICVTQPASSHETPSPVLPICMLILLSKSPTVATHSLILSLISLGRHEEHSMPKNAGQSLKVTRAPPKPQPSRQIKRFAPPPTPLVRPMSPGAPKFADQLKPAAKPKSGSINPKQMVY